MNAECYFLFNYPENLYFKNKICYNQSVDFKRKEKCVMDKFCGMCGSPVDELTGKCPNCDKTEISEGIKPQPALQTGAGINSTASEGAADSSWLEPDLNQGKKERKKADKKSRKAKDKKAEKTPENGKKKKLSKKSKAVISVVLVMCILLGTVSCVLFAGPSKKEAVTMGQWVELITNYFGIENYTAEKPYFKNIEKDNPMFSSFQAVAELGIIEPSDKITTETPLKWNEALISLVTAIGFLGDEVSDKDKINYAIENIDNSFKKYKGLRYITLEEATPLLQRAKELWETRTFEERVEEITYKDGVKDFSASETIKYTSNKNTVVCTSNDLDGLKMGDIYVLPANERSVASINKVKSISKTDGKTVVVNDESFADDEALECIEDYVLQETQAFDYTQIVGVYDEAGNSLLPEDNELEANAVESVRNCTPTYMVYKPSSSDARVEQTGVFDKIEPELEIKTDDGLSGKISFSKDGVSFAVEQELSKNEVGNQETEVIAFVNGTIEDINITNDIKIKKKEVYVRVDYESKIEGGVKASTKTDLISDEGEDYHKPLADVIGYFNQSIEEFGLIADEKTGSTEFYICRITITGAQKLGSVDFIIKGQVDVSGEVKIVVEIDGSKGVDYRNGVFKYIKEKKQTEKFIAEGKFEVTVGPGIGVYLLDKIDVFEFVIEFGVGAEVKRTVHLVDEYENVYVSHNANIDAKCAELFVQKKMSITSEEVKSHFGVGKYNIDKNAKEVNLYNKVCYDWAVYPIVKISVSEKCLVSKLVKKVAEEIADEGKISLSIEIVGKDDVSLKGHIEFPNNLLNALSSDSFFEGFKDVLGVGAECTVKNAAVSTTPDNNNSSTGDLPDTSQGTSSEQYLTIEEAVDVVSYYCGFVEPDYTVTADGGFYKDFKSSDGRECYVCWFEGNPPEYYDGDPYYVFSINDNYDGSDGIPENEESVWVNLRTGECYDYDKISGDCYVMDIVTDAVTVEVDLPEYDEIFYYNLPKFNSIKGDMGTINDEILSEFEEDALAGDPNVCPGLSYSWTVTGDVISVIIRDGGIYNYELMKRYKVYNVSASTGNVVSAADLCEAVRISPDDYDKLLLDAVTKKSQEYNSDPVLGDLRHQQHAKTIAQENLDEAMPYIDVNGDLCAIVKVYISAGPDSVYESVKLYSYPDNNDINYWEKVTYWNYSSVGFEEKRREIPFDAVEFSGHYYQFYDDARTWTEAKEMCEVVGGHLVTISSIEEQNLITNILNKGNKNLYWIGLEKAGDSWMWITGEVFSFENWAENEPNNYNNDELYGCCFQQTYTGGEGVKYPGKWNDASNEGAEYSSQYYNLDNYGYICEWDI